MRLLLNQRSSENIARNLQYYEYLLAARRDHMHTYLDTLQRLSGLQQQIAVAVQSLKDTQAQLQQDYSQLLGKRDERKQLLASLDADLKDKGSDLAELERNRASLQKVIDRIEKERALAEAREQQRLQQEEQAKREQERLAKDNPQLIQPPTNNVPTPAPVNASPAPAETQSKASYSAGDLAKLQTQSFTQGKGKLPWPVNGKVVNAFGETRQGQVTWDGLRIRAQAGSDVRAVHYGRVMYAEWLRGQGLLIILDHGNGYMSLYANNDVLLHEPGEWVQAGEPIARVGNSGGEKDPGLYFEIRKNGEPQDPRPWLARK